MTRHRVRVGAWAGTDESGGESGIGRVPLRRLLAHGLGEALSFGKELTHHQVHPDGDVTACFADGSSDRADLLVDPDGAGSTVGRARLQPADLYNRTADADLPLREPGRTG